MTASKAAVIEIEHTSEVCSLENQCHVKHPATPSNAGELVWDTRGTQTNSQHEEDTASNQITQGMGCKKNSMGWTQDLSLFTSV